MASSIITSVITGGSNNHDTVAEELNAYATDWVTQGVVGSITNTSGSAPSTGSFAVNQDSSPDMGITVSAGQAYVQGTPSTQDSQVVRARMTSNYTSYTINTNTSGSTKYDWIYLSFSAANATNPDAAADNVVTLFTSRSTSNGNDTGSPPTYGILLAVVTVANNASSITNANIADQRTQAQLSVPGSTGSTGWNSLGYALTYGANNGNKEFTVTTPNNLTGILSSGMRFQVTRAVTPPTECMAFVSSSSQYATATSPAGITFTGNFSCEAWIYLNSSQSAQTAIIGRDSSAASGSGWEFNISNANQIGVFWRNASGNSAFESQASLPLNQWVHVAVVCTTATPAAVFYINGAVAASSSAFTAATSVVQASTNLTVAKENASSQYLNGYLSEVRVWNAAITQATIRANMGINLPGSTTNLIALFQGNGNFTDSTTNANNLTATNGAVATQVSNPYNDIEYANIIGVSYSSPNTTITLSTGDYGTIPNMTLNNAYYSVAALPFGFPTVLRNLISRVSYVGVAISIAATSYTAAGGLSVTCTIPENMKVKITVWGVNTYPNGGAATTGISIWDGTVGSGLELAASELNQQGSGGYAFPAICEARAPVTAGSHTFNVGMKTGNVSFPAVLTGAGTTPSYIFVEAA